MPLVTIKTSHAYFPQGGSGFYTPDQKKTAKLATSLPAIFVKNEAKLYMDHGTPEKGVQVTIEKFGEADVNTPAIWILIEFSEGDLTDQQQLEATGVVKELLVQQFAEFGYPHNLDYAFDVRWSPSHGSLSIGGRSLTGDQLAAPVGPPYIVTGDPSGGLFSCDNPCRNSPRLST